METHFHHLYLYVFKKLFNLVSKHPVLCIALAITFIVYFKFLFFSHISWDDPEMVFRNKDVKSFNLVALFTNHYVGNYIPATMLLHAISWFVFGSNDWGHHLLNILFHLTNGVLVYEFVNRLFKNKNMANITAAVFLLHPLQLESVGWISEMKNVVSATFYLAAMIYYVRFSEHSVILSKAKNLKDASFVSITKDKNYLITILLFVLACLSKSSAVVFPLALIGIDIIFNQKLSFKFLINKIPMFLISLLFGIINIKTQTADLFINHAHEFPFYERIGYAGFALVKYVEMFLFPVNLSVLYPYPPNKILAFVIGFAFIVVLVALILISARKKNWTIFSLILLCLIHLVLVLQFLPFGEVLYADRYMYLSLMFFTLFAAKCLSFGEKNFVRVTYVLIFIFGTATFFRANVWKNSASLYSDILKKFPNSFVALNSLGAELMFQNEDKRALEYLNKAVAVSPQNYKGYYNRGLLYLKNGEANKALRSLNQALAIYDYPKAYVARASAYYMLQDFSKAMNDANHVLKLDVNNSKAHFVLGNCYNDLNQLDKAINEYNICIAINDDEPDFYFKRAIALGKQQDFVSCINDLEMCLNLNPNYYEAYYWRGVAKVNLNQNPCADFKIAAQQNDQAAIVAYNKYCR